VTQLFILRVLSGKYTERQILRYSMLMVAVVIASYAFLGNVPLLFFFIPILAVPQGLSMANLGALVSKSVSAEKQGAALGINGSLQALAAGVIPLVAGVGSGIVGLQLPFIAGAFLVVLAWSALFIMRRSSVRNSVSTPA
jgi:MFS transporter, DHA1 family, tetracycline resistance protein